MNTRQRAEEACAVVTAMIEAEAEAGQTRAQEAVTRALDLHGSQENAAFSAGVVSGGAIGFFVSVFVLWLLG